MAQFNIRIAKARLFELIQKVRLGEEVIIARDNQPVVKLTALQPAKHKRRLGSAKGWITLTPDFDAPLENFKNYGNDFASK